MGVYDRDYYREDEAPQGFQLGGTRMMVSNLVIITVAIFVIDSFTSTTQYLVEIGFGRDKGVKVVTPDELQSRRVRLRQEGLQIREWVHSRWLSGLMTLRGDLPSHPWNFWQLLASGFAHAPLGSKNGIFHVGFNMFMLWMFGRAVEEKYGPKEFLRFYLIAIVTTGFVWLLVQNLLRGPFGGMLGASGGVTAVVILFVLNYPNQTLLLLGIVPIKAWVFGLLCVGLDFFGALGAHDNVAYESHLAGAGFALAYFHFGWRFGQVWPRRLTRAASWFSVKPKLRVHDPSDVYRDLMEEGDRILAKIHREGEDSLTSKERRILEDYSRRMREKHQ